MGSFNKILGGQEVIQITSEKAFAGIMTFCASENSFNRRVSYGK